MIYNRYSIRDATILKGEKTMVLIESQTNPIEAKIYDEAFSEKQISIEIYRDVMPDKNRKSRVNTWVICAKYSEAMSAFSDLTGGLTTQDKRLMDRIIEVQFQCREKDGDYEVNVWFGIKGCYHRYYYESFECASETDLSKVCCQEFARVFKGREILYEITNGLDRCSAEVELRCVRCGCEAD